MMDSSNMDVTVVASSFAPGTEPADILAGSGGVWKPNPALAEERPRVTLDISTDENSAIVSEITLNTDNVDKVIATLYQVDEYNENVVKTLEVVPDANGKVAFNFGGERGNRIVLEIVPDNSTTDSPRVGNLQGSICYHPQITTTTTIITIATTAPCAHMCSDRSCINGTLICNGVCNCPGDCSDEEYCGTGSTAPTVITTLVPGGWSNWSPFANCSVTCGVGIQIRTRDCLATTIGFNPCPGADLESKECIMPSCPTIPNWTPWTPWTPCNVPCGTGTQTRYRECNNPAPLPGQEGCLGPANETITCDEQPCECEFTPVSFKNLLGYESSDIVGWVEKDGVFGPTSPEENVYLGDPIQNGVTVHVLCSNCTCVDGEISCAIEECALQNCTYSSWSEWTPCSKTCDVGQMSRNRSLIASVNQHTCSQPLDEFQDCNTDACPTLHPWSPWSEWTACSTTEPCQVGTISRTRICPDSGCVGDAMELETCTNACEEVINCTTGKVWSNCSNLCPLTCQAARMGVCSEPEACVPGCVCPVGQVEYNGQCVKIDSCPCYDEFGNIILPGFSYTSPLDSCESCTCYNGTLSCAVDAECCSWSTWGEWGACGVSCGEGTKNRYRTLQSGSNCGESMNTAPCYMGECPPGCIIDGVGYAYGDIISNDGCEQCSCSQTGNKYCFNNTAAIVDGEWSAWSAWFDCSASCNGGMKARTRLCNDPLPACNGFPCVGDNIEFTPCNEAIDCCDVSPWSDWSDCSVSCGSGQQMRSRDYVDANSTMCAVNLLEQRACDYGECNMSCVISPWSEWSGCSKSCGNGDKVRDRSILVPAFDCPNNLEEVATCDHGPCECETNQVWADYSLCEMSCEEMVYGFDPAQCAILSEGCMCQNGFYRNQNGSCVNASTCELCITDSGIKQPGEIWDSPSDSCYMCECVSGVEICTRKCEIPTCSADEILSYDVPNSCCPICIAVPTTCTKYTRYEKLVDDVSDCETVNEVPIDYCAGSCGNSTTTTSLMLQLADEAISQDCKCCTGTLGDLLEVDVVCGAARTPAKAYLYRLLQCSCNICLSTGSPIKR